MPRSSGVGGKVRRAVAAVARVCVQFGVTATLLLSVSDTGAVNLLEVYRLAVKNDPEYLSAGSANRAAQEQTPQARSQLLPELSLSASSDFNHEKTRQAGTFGGAGTTRFNASTFRLSLSQPIYRKDLLIGLNQADTRVRQSNAEFAFALQELMLRASERYFDALRAVDNLEFLRSERDANEQQLKQSQQRFEVGLIAITDVEEAKAGFDIANAQVIEAEIELDNSWEALRELTGFYLDLITLKPLIEDTPLITPVPNNVDEWTEIALTQNLQLTAALLATETAQIEIRRQEAQHVPTLDLVASHDVTQSGGRFGDTDIVTSSIGVQLNLPIYQGGEVLSRTRESRHLHQQSLDDLERQRRITQRQTRDAFRGVISGISRVQALMQAVVSTQAALEAIEAGFQVGTRTSVDVLNAQRDLFRAKRDFSESRYDYILDILRLKQAAGILSEDDLTEVNGWLE